LFKISGKREKGREKKGNRKRKISEIFGGFCYSLSFKGTAPTLQIE